MLRPTTTNYNPMNISEFVKTSFGEEKIMVFGTFGLKIVSCPDPEQLTTNKL